MAKRGSVPKDGWEEYVRRLRVELEQKYGGRNEQLDLIEEHREMAREPKIPEQYKKTATQHRGPQVYRFLNRVASLMAKSLPQAKVLPMNPTDEEQRKSSEREKWFNDGVYPLMNETEDFFLKFVDNTVSNGVGVIKCLLRPHLWAIKRDENEPDEDYNERVKVVHRRNFPFVWRNVPTRAWYPLYDDDGLSECIEVYQDSAQALMRRYPRLTYDQLNIQKDYMGQLTKIEYWNRTHAVYIVKNKIVDKFTHDYGRPPYFEAQANVEKQSMAFPLLHLQDTYNSFVTMILNYAYYTAFPISHLKRTHDDAFLPENIDKQSIRLVQGETAVAPMGYDYEFLQFPRMSAEVHEALAIVKQVMDEVSLAPVLYGLSPGSDTSGAALHPLIAIAKAVLGPATTSIARAFDEMAHFILERIVEDLKEPVPVYVREKKDGVWRGKWLEQGPDDIKHYYKVVHELQPVIPAERQVNTMYLAALHGQGFIPKRYVVEEGLGEPAPEELLDERWIEDFEMTPEFTAPLKAEFARQLRVRLGLPPSGQGTLAGAPLAPGGQGVPMMPGVQGPVQEGM